MSVVEELSKLRTIDPNLGDNDGNTPLHYASQAGMYRIFCAYRVLTIINYSPRFAFVSGLSEAVDILIAKFGIQLDVNCRNSAGLTPLMKAALQGRTRCAKSLIAGGNAQRESIDGE